MNYIREAAEHKDLRTPLLDWHERHVDRMQPPRYERNLRDPMTPEEYAKWSELQLKKLLDLNRPPSPTTPPKPVAAEFELVGDDPKLTEIQAQRQKVYGDPLENHRGIAMAWVGLLRPHWEAIRDGHPIPSWTVAHLMCALKLNRMRRVFSQDNYDDARNYAAFAEKWQRENTP